MILTRSPLRRLIVGSALLVAFTPPSAEAQSEALPTPEAVIARYVEAIGGRPAFDAIQGMRTRGTFEMPGAGVRGELEVIARRPNLSRTEVRVPGLGTMSGGHDGSTAWSLNPMMGPRVLQGTERDQTLEQAEFDLVVRDARFFQSMETIGTDEVNGAECVELRLVTLGGREVRDCFSTGSGLLVRSVATQESPMGSVEVVTYFEDYNAYGGILMASRVRQSVMGQEQVVTISAVEIESIPHEEFALPAEIQALVDAGS